MVSEQTCLTSGNWPTYPGIGLVSYLRSRYEGGLDLYSSSHNREYQLGSRPVLNPELVAMLYELPILVRLKVVACQTTQKL